MTNKQWLEIELDFSNPCRKQARKELSKQFPVKGVRSKIFRIYADKEQLRRFILNSDHLSEHASWIYFS